MAKKHYNDQWMYEKPKCPYKNPRPETKAKYDHRPLPRLPTGWPTDKLSRTHMRPDGVYQLSHPQREILILCERRWEWVHPCHLHDQIKDKREA